MILETMDTGSLDSKRPIGALSRHDQRRWKNNRKKRELGVYRNRLYDLVGVLMIGMVAAYTGLLKPW